MTTKTPARSSYYFPATSTLQLIRYIHSGFVVISVYPFTLVNPLGVNVNWLVQVSYRRLELLFAH